MARAIELDPALPGPHDNRALIEKCDRFDAPAPARWLALCWQRASDDPDGLFARLEAEDATATSAREGK